MWIFSLLVGLAAAETSTTQVTTSSLQLEEAKQERKWQAFGELSLESKQQNLSDQRGDTHPGVQNLALGIEYQFTPELLGVFEILGEQNQNDTNVYFGQLYLAYDTPFLDGMQFQVGNRYYDYGVLTGQEGLLTRRPDYYSDLLVTRRGIDLGASLQYQPLQSQPLSISYSYFLGQTLRPGDQNLEQAEMDPQYINLSYAPEFLDVKLTYLIRRYQNRPEFTAMGAALGSKEFEFWKGRIRLSAQSEYWSLNYSRQDGFERVGESALLGTYFEFFRVFHRGIFSQEQWSSAGSQNLTSRFSLNGLGVRINEHFLIEYQNIRGGQSQTSFNLQTANEEALRVMLRL